MVNFYHQYTEQVTEDQWKRRTGHVTVNCPEIELLLSKGHMVIDAVVASSSQTSEQGESPATTGNSVSPKLRDLVAILKASATISTTAVLKVLYLEFPQLSGE